MKLREITSGFLYYDKSKKPVVFSDAKLNVLKEVLEEIPKEYQVVIWCIFREEIKLISEKLKSAVAIYGNTPIKERDRILIDFLNGKYKYLVAHPRTLGHGVNLTNCSYAIYYSLDWSAELWSQSQDRIHRIGQKKKLCLYFFTL